MTTRCEEIEELLAVQVSDELSTGDQKRLEEHIKACEGCAQLHREVAGDFRRQGRDDVGVELSGLAGSEHEMAQDQPAGDCIESRNSEYVTAPEFLDELTHSRPCPPA